MSSPFPCSPVIHECSWKKSQIEKKNGFTRNVWFSTQKKCSFMLLDIEDWLQINLVCGDEILKKTKQETVLGVTLDNKLDFATPLWNVTKNVNKKLNTLTRVQIYITTDQKSLYFPPLLNRNLPTVF